MEISIDSKRMHEHENKSIGLLSFHLQSIERIPDKANVFNEADEDGFDEEEESKFCTLPRSSNGFTIRHVSIFLIW